MVKITIEGTEYDTDNMTDKQKELIEVLKLNTQTANLIRHASDCVNAIGRVKIDELTDLLLSDNKKRSEEAVTELKASLSDGKKD